MPSQIKYFPKTEICRIFKKWEKPRGFTEILDPEVIDLFYQDLLSEEWNINGTYKNFIIKFPLYIGVKKEIHTEEDFIEYLIDIFKEKFTKDQLNKFNLELEENDNPQKVCADLQLKNKDLYTQNCDLEKQLEERDKEIAQLKNEKDSIIAKWKHEVTSIKNSHQLDINRYQREEKKSEYIIKMLEDKMKSLEIEAQINLDF